MAIIKLISIFIISIFINKAMNGQVSMELFSIEKGVVFISEEKLDDFLDVRTALINKDKEKIKHYLNIIISEQSTPNRTQHVAKIVNDYYELVFYDGWLSNQQLIKRFVLDDIIYTYENINDWDLNDVQQTIYLDRFFNYFLNIFEPELWYISPQLFLTDHLMDVFEIASIKIDEQNLYRIYSLSDVLDRERAAIIIDINELKNKLRHFRPKTESEKIIINLFNKYIDNSDKIISIL